MKNTIIFALLLILTLLTACGKRQGNAIIQDAELEMYYNEVKNRFNEVGLSTTTFVDLYIKFETLQQNNSKYTTQGVCTVSPGMLQIKIDQNRWVKLDEKQKLLLIAHEMGHCVVGLPHFEERIDLMNAVMTKNLLDIPTDIIFDQFFERLSNQKRAPILNY